MVNLETVEAIYDAFGRGMFAASAKSRTTSAVS